MERGPKGRGQREGGQDPPRRQNVREILHDQKGNGKGKKKRIRGGGQPSWEGVLGKKGGENGEYRDRERNVLEALGVVEPGGTYTRSAGRKVGQKMRVDRPWRLGFFFC